MRNEVEVDTLMPAIQSVFNNPTDNNNVVLHSQDLILKNFSNDDLEKAWRVKAIIEKEYFKSHTVADLAQMAGTNKSTLNLAFKATTGLPVKKYIRDFRIEKARQLLETSCMAIEIIASRVGLHRTNLEKNFKKRYGKSPKEWRKTRIN